MNKSETWFHGNYGCGHGWWHHVTEWAGFVLPPLSSHCRTREPSHEDEEEDGRFSVYRSLSISIKERFPCHACLCECVNGCICPSSSSPHLPLCACELALLRRVEVGRCHGNHVTAYWSYSGGEWPSGEIRHLCRVSLPGFKGVWWGSKGGAGLVDDWGFGGPLQGHSRNWPALYPVLCHPGPGSQPDQCLFIISLCSLLLIPPWVGWSLWCFKCLSRGELATNHRAWPGLTPTSEYGGYTGSVHTVLVIY